MVTHNIHTDTTSPPTPAWRWVASAYFAQGVPFAVVMSAAGTLLKDLHYPDALIAQVLGLTSIAWSIKPLYAGWLEQSRPLRSWITGTECGMALLLLFAALSLRLEDPFWPIAGVLACVALGSATQDIAIDGVFVTSLGERAQSRWAGFCGSAWNIGRMFASALMVGLASGLQRSAHWQPRSAWAAALLLAALCLCLLALYHRRVLPHGKPRPRIAFAQQLTEFRQQWRALFHRPGIWGMLAYVAFYRTSEGFLLLEVPLFLQASTADRGLGLCATTQITANCPHLLSDRALLDGVLGTIVSGVFGVLGGKFLERNGLTRRSLLLMALCLNVPHLSIVLLSQLAQTQHAVSLPIVIGLTLLEKAGYSFGFVANMVYIMQRIAPGEHPTAHYAFATSVMQLMLIPTQALSGVMAERLGYAQFFTVTCLAALPSLWVAYRAPLERV